MDVDEYIRNSCVCYMRTSSSPISLLVTKEPTRETDHSLAPSAEARQTCTTPPVRAAKCFRRPAVLTSTTRVQSHQNCFALVVKWVAMLHVREVLGSYPDPRAALRTGGFHSFARFYHTNAEIAPTIRPRPIPSASFPISNHPIRTYGM